MDDVERYWIVPPQGRPPQWAVNIGMGESVPGIMMHTLFNKNALYPTDRCIGWFDTKNGLFVSEGNSGFWLSWRYKDPITKENSLIVMGWEELLRSEGVTFVKIHVRDEGIFYSADYDNIEKGSSKSLGNDRMRWIVPGRFVNKDPINK